MRALIAIAVLAVSAWGAFAHPGHEAGEPHEWVLVPEYVLPGRAANRVGPRPAVPQSVVSPLAYDPAPIRLFGLACTDRVTGLLTSRELPYSAFSVELWVLDHVNRPVGAAVLAKGAGPGSDGSAGVAWGVGYANGRAFMSWGSGERFLIEAPTRKWAFKKYWSHVVGVYDGVEMRLYLDGKQVGSSIVPNPGYTAQTQLELAGFTEHEPFMALGNVLQRVVVYPSALEPEAIGVAAAQMRDSVERGVLYPGVFHFTAGPMLNSATQRSMALIWETDRAATATVSYGRGVPMEHEVRVSDPARIQEVVLEGLEPSTSYFYRVVAEDSDGATIDSGLLTFKTAVREGEAVSFAIIGDTEARPFVNDRVAKLIWDERPDFVINCGDLTDGGKEPNKFQWTHEYFLGMTQLVSRVPVFPVAGNGEGDLYWYKRYHALPGTEGYYAFRYGNAEFFMLDSNRRASDFRPGGEQYEWLARGLAASDAVWKFVAHHHPVYTSDEDDYGDTFAGERSDMGDLNVRRMSELYERYGVDAVFFGHLHTYERSLPIAGGVVDYDEGVVYVQAGGAGGNLEDFAPTRNWFKGKTMRGYHYCTVSLHGGRFELRMYGTDGSLRDVVTVTKPEPTGALSSEGQADAGNDG